MTLTNTKAALGLATVILTIVSIIGGAVTRLETRFAALDTRLGKLESAVKALNAVTSDENYRTLIKELMAQETSGQLVPKKADSVHVYGIKGIADCTKDGCTYTDAGAAADAPAVKVPQ